MLRLFKKRASSISACGAFTGAMRGGKPGLFELADTGTIFLDEIGDLSFSLQAKLLRTIQEREIVRVGGSEIISVNVRIIAATNKNLLELGQDGLWPAGLKRIDLTFWVPLAAFTAFQQFREGRRTCAAPPFKILTEK